LYAFFATEYEDLNFAKTCAAANFIGNDSSGEFIMLNSISNVIHAKSSDISQKQPAANSDALTCKNQLQYMMQIINQSAYTEVWLNTEEFSNEKYNTIFNNHQSEVMSNDLEHQIKIRRMIYTSRTRASSNTRRH
jgi:hypothetical protein